MFTSNVSHFQYLFTTIVSRNLIYFVLIGIECDENGMLVKSTHDVQTINQLNCLMSFQLKKHFDISFVSNIFLLSNKSVVLKVYDYSKVKITYNLRDYLSFDKKLI